mmetsp:Transcript_11489/g.29177  ORF Transcript_11489/g.29177 Transcript_11489/m.29177 type:complete len:154 (+) Transcript_11489:609-1070(+)
MPPFPLRCTVSRQPAGVDDSGKDTDDGEDEEEVEGLNQQQDLEDERVPDLPSLDSAGEGIREDESDGPTGMEAEHKAVDQQPLPSVADAGAAGVDDSGKDTDDGEDEEEVEGLNQQQDLEDERVPDLPYNQLRVLCLWRGGRRVLRAGEAVIV